MIGKIRTITTFFVILLSLSLNAQVKEYFGATPDLKVSGKEFVDPQGNAVTLHGVMDTPNAYFNGNRWCEGIAYPYYNQPGAVEAVKKYFTKIFQAIANPDKGTYCNLFRLHLDPAWTNDPNKTATNGGNENDISRFSADRLRTYLESLYIPIAKDALAHGLYVIIRPPGVFPEDVTVGDAYNEYLKTVWDIVTQNEWVKTHPGQVMLELGNEPVRMNGNLADYFQPIVNKIRSNGFTGILLLPGTSYQADYRNYATKAINDTNFGYAVHNYPGWYGGWDANQTEEQFISTFETQVPVNSKPIVITEVDWSPMKEGAGHWNEMHTQYTEGNFGTWGTGTTNSPAPNVTYKNTQNVGWGMRFKHLVDKYPNISWTLQGTTTYVDMDAYLKDETVQSAFTEQMKAAGYSNTNEACSGACFDWFKQYACGERLPRPYYKTNAENVGGNDRAWFDNTNNRYYFGQPNYCAFIFNDFAGTELDKCADFTIKLNDATIGYRLDVQLTDASGNIIKIPYPTEEEPSKKEDFVIGSETTRTRITDVNEAKAVEGISFNFQELFKDYLGKGYKIGKIRLNTVVGYGNEDTQKTGKYYIELDKMEMNVSQVTARKSTGTSLTEIPMCEHAKDGNQKLLKEYASSVKNTIVSLDGESGAPLGGWGTNSTSEIVTIDGKNCYKLYNPSAVEYWGVQRIIDCTLPQGKEYILTLDIKGSQDGNIRAAFHDGTHGCGDLENIHITTGWNTVTVKGTVTSYDATKIYLNIGDYVGTIYIDNIEVYTETRTASGYEDKIGSGESVSTIYGFQTPNYASYVDISDYKSIKFTGTAPDGKIRLFLNNSKKLDGTTKEYYELIDVNSTFDLSTLPYVHLHSIKASSYDKTASLSSVILTKKSDDSEVSLSSLPYCQWDVKAEGEIVREISSFNKNIGTSITNGEIYGVNGNVYYLEYVDLSDYTKMAIKGTGDNLRVLFNRIADGGPVVELNPSLSSGEAIIDLRNIDNNGFVHLHSIKTYGTVNVESITLINENDPNTFADYYISGAGSHASSANEALADANATVIDLSGFTGKWVDNFTSANPNCILIYKEDNKIDSPYNGRNLAKRNGSTYDTSSIALKDGHPFRSPVNIATVTDATYTRTLTNGNWGTMALPFDLKISELGDKSVYKLTGDNGGSLSFTKVTSDEQVKAGTVILYNNPSSGETILKGKDIAKTAEGFNIQPVGENGWFTAQSFTSQVIDDVKTHPVLKDYEVYAISGNKFVHATKKLTLKPFRALYLLEKTRAASISPLSSYSIRIEDEANGISDTYNASEAPETIRFDMMGRRISSPVKGVNIIRTANGVVKKVINK